MKTIDLTEEQEDLVCLCLEDWSEAAKEAGPKRRQWLDRCQQQGLRAKLAVDDNGVEGGMIQYGPIEHSFVDGEGLYFAAIRNACASSIVGTPDVAGSWDPAPGGCQGAA